MSNQPIAIPAGSWLFKCSRCLTEVRITIIMPRLSPSAQCVKCKHEMECTESSTRPTPGDPK